MSRIYTTAVADLFHVGHVEFFRRARALGSHLTVCVVPDERVSQGKGRLPVMSVSERAAVVAACRYVDAVLTDGPRMVGLEFMLARGYDVYTFAAANDAELAHKLAGCADLPTHMVAPLPYTVGISTTEIIHRVAARLAASKVAERPGCTAEEG